MKSTSITFSVEVGGHELLVHGDATPEDPGRVSGPPENCWPPEAASFDPTKIELLVSVTEDLSLTPMKRNVYIDITDLCAELSQGILDEVVERAFEDWQAEPPPDDGPEDD